MSPTKNTTKELIMFFKNFILIISFLALKIMALNNLICVFPLLPFYTYILKCLLMGKPFHA